MNPAVLGLAALGAALLASTMVNAGQLGTRRAPLLLFEMWCSTDADGHITSDQRRFRLGWPGSTGAGLQASWSGGLEQALDAASLQLAPLAWVDPVAQHTLVTLLAPGVRPAVTAPMTVLPRAAGSQPPVVTVADLELAFDHHLRPQAATLAAALRGAMQQRGADQAWLAFHQQVQLNGVPVVLVWSLHVTGNGYWVAGTPHAQVSGSSTLVARYVSRSAAQGLPSAYAYGDAGWLQWGLRDRQGQLLGALQSQDLAGGFDGAAGLGCLLGNLPVGIPGIGAAAPAGAPVPAASASGDSACSAMATRFNLPQLALQLGASAIELDYLDGLQPRYLADTAGTRTALVALQVDRVLYGQGNDCSQPPWRYRNDYQAAFQLEARLQHFSRAGAGGWVRAPAVRYLVAGTLQPWRSVSITLQPAQRADVDQLLIDPEAGTAVDRALFSARVAAVQASAVRCAMAMP